jgi:hypothetical protein
LSLHAGQALTDRPKWGSYATRVVDEQGVDSRARQLEGAADRTGFEGKGRRWAGGVRIYTTRVVDEQGVDEKRQTRRSRSTRSVAPLHF